MKTFIQLISFIVIALLISALTVTAYLNKGNIPSEFSIENDEDKFTELFFEKHTNLPYKISQGKIYSFAFTVNNHEQMDMAYPYEVFITLADEKFLLDKGVISVKDSESHTKKIEFRINDPFLQTKVTVSLPEQDQQINFLIIGEQQP